MCTHLFSRPGSSNYYLRRVIPKDLQAHYGKREILKSLRTPDRREAERRCRAEGCRLDEEFQAARAAIADAAAHPPRTYTDPRTVTGEPPVSAEVASQPVDIPAHAAVLLARIRHDHAQAVVKGADAVQAQRNRLETTLWIDEEVLAGREPPAHPVGFYEAQRDAIRAFLRGDGSVQYEDATRVNSASPRGRTRAAGASGKAPESLLGLVDKWAVERKPAKQTIQVQERTVRRFTEATGIAAPRRITPDHVLLFKDKLLADGLDPKTVNLNLSNLGTLLNFGVKNRFLADNAAAGIRVERSKAPKEARIPFNQEALNKIFSCPVYSSGERPKSAGGEAAYWLPLLALFTGARLEELAQLAPDDVREETYYSTAGKERRAWVIHITDRGQGQGLKNSGSRRQVPVHAELVRLGFIKCVQARSAAGPGGQQSRAGQHRIFDLRVDPLGREGSYWGKWFAKYLRTVIGITDKRMVFHSFRHTFKHWARWAGITEEVSDALTGHSDGRVSRAYGDVLYPLGPLVEAMKKYRVPGITLPKPPATSKLPGQSTGEASR